MSQKRKNNVLLKLYQDSKQPNSYGSIQGLFQNSRNILPSITRRDVTEFLKSIKAYTLHKITNKKFPRRKVIASGPGVIAACDLADMSLLSRFNKGYKYILVFIDIFSRYAQCLPLKKKDGNTVCTALKKILNSGYFNNLKRLNTDEGREFYNKIVKQLLLSKDITLYSVSSREIKASIAERFIRTLKGKLYRYMTHKNTKKYIHILQDITNSYNHTVHTSLCKKHTPIQVHQLTDQNQIQNLFNRMYKNATPISNPVISSPAVGEYTRIAQTKPSFQRGYTVQNTVEIFKISHIDTSQSPTVYRIEDLQGEPIKGIFYREELIPTSPPEFFNIDILRTKTVRGRKKYYVKWRGYPDKFNSWVDESQLSSV